MKIDPEYEAVLDFLPALDLADVHAVRAQMDAMREARGVSLPEGWADGVSIALHEAPGPAGAPPVPVHVVTPDGPVPAGGRGCLVYIHGGAFVLGDAESTLPTCARFAREAGIVVVDVEYRLAPEFPYPAGFEDCYAALVWTAAQVSALGVDLRRVGVGGASAGGNLAAAVSLAAAERGGPALAYQLLLYPVIDNEVSSWSVKEFHSGVPLWTGHATHQMWPLYLGDWEGEVPPTAAPARARDLVGQPPAFVLTCQYDPLRDEGLAYAQRLLEARVPVELHLFPGTFHGYDLAPTRVTGATLQLASAALSAALGTPAG